MRVVRILVIGIGLAAIFAISLWSARPAMPQSFGCVHQTISDVGSHRADPFERLTCGTTTTVVTTSTTTSTSTSSTTTTSTSTSVTTTTSTSTSTSTSSTTSSLVSDAFSRGTLGSTWTNDSGHCRIVNSSQLEPQDPTEQTICEYNVAAPSGSYPSVSEFALAGLTTNRFLGPAFVIVVSSDGVACVTDGATVKMIALDNGTLSQVMTTTLALTPNSDCLAVERQSATAFQCHRRVACAGPYVAIGTAQTVNNIATTGQHWGGWILPTTTTTLP